jgi:hypothetical protein
MAAPSTCTTTGAGEASIRGLAGISCGPPATSSSRSDPEITGMRLRATSAMGTRQPDFSAASGGTVGVVI